MSYASQESHVSYGALSFLPRIRVGSGSSRRLPFIIHWWTLASRKKGGFGLLYNTIGLVSGEQTVQDKNNAKRKKLHKPVWSAWHCRSRPPCQGEAVKVEINIFNSHNLVIKYYQSNPEPTFINICHLFV